MEVSTRWSQLMFFPLIVLILSLYTSPCMSFEPEEFPSCVKEVCKKSGQQYDYCMAVMNTGSVMNANMKFLSYYTKQFAEDNCTIAIERISSTLIPNIPDPYIQEVLTVCKDAFSLVKDKLSHQVSPMIVVRDEFEQAKPWVNYGMGLVSACRSACLAKPQTVCPLINNINDTQGMLKLLSIVLDLLTQGVV